MKTKYIEWKLKIVESEIEKLERTEQSVGVNLRQNKEKQWDLIEQLEKQETK